MNLTDTHSHKRFIDSQVRDSVFWQVNVMPSTLIRGKQIICKVLSRTEAEIIEEGAVFQQDGKIVEIGSYEALSAKYQPDTVLGSANHIVMPGFVNSHHHVGLTPFQLGSLDYPFRVVVCQSSLGAGSRFLSGYLVLSF